MKKKKLKTIKKIIENKAKYKHLIITKKKQKRKKYLCNINK